MRRTNQKGFTLMELMVVIVIVAILAAVAVPLYLNYVKDATRTEAKGAIGAVITSQQAYFQKHPDLGYAGDLATLKTENLIDLTEPEVNWTFAIGGGGVDGYTVTATGVTGKPSNGLTQLYTFQRATGGTWTP